jgi:hypothetical protein
MAALSYMQRRASGTYEFRKRLPESLAGKPAPSHIRDFVEALPLPDVLPPKKILHARRIDAPAEIRRLALEWSNCLSSGYLDRINEGRYALYLWDHDGVQAACMIRRYGRLGWCLDEIKGSNNKEIPRAHERPIMEAFDAVGIPKDSSLIAIEQVVSGGEET